jgi:hypothetical protein
MTDYLAAILFLVVVFVGFGLAHGNHGGRGCHDCDSDGACEKTACDKS